MSDAVWFAPVQEAPDEDRGSLSGHGVQNKDIRTATHDGEPPSAFGLERREFQTGRRMVARKADAVVFDVRHDPIRF